jgi:sugar lactone lactonase YvrE
VPRSVVIITCGLLLLGAPAGVAAQSPAAPSAATSTPGGRIDLPPGWQPEGIATDGAMLYVGSLADGAIWRGDPETGTGETLVHGTEGSVGVGLEYEAAADRLWVAGGGTGEVRAYDVATGELLESYPVEGAGFLNDVAVTATAAYVTDSSAASLVVIPIGTDRSLGAPEDVSLLELGGDYEHVPEAFNLNGIVASGDQLLAVQSATGTLYRIDPASGDATVVDTGGYALNNGDGLEVRDGELYVVRNQDGLIAVLALAEGLHAAELVTELTSPDFDVPTTVAITADSLWAANARFGTEPGPETEYWISRLALPEPTA